jgi:hypothetical protein
MIALSTREQLKRIKRGFPNLIIEKKGRKFFSVVIRLKPSLISCYYDVRITFSRNKRLSVFVINNTLEVAKNRTKLPHVFSHKDQKLCLYQFDDNKWTPEQSIASTIIPWASEWLYYYEFWLIDGEWYGGGHDEYSKENKEAIENDKV